MATGCDLRIFLDSNVIISGIYSKAGPPGKILDLHTAGRIQIVVCKFVLEEVIRNIRVKRSKDIPALYAFLSNAPPSIAVDPGINEILLWAKYLSQEDAIILAAAIRARVDCFITGDRHFRSAALQSQKMNLKILTPAEFVAAYK
jgi:putative PIN family toxin of toxin-antitoxin system